MPTVVVTSRFLFGPNPKGQTEARYSFASLETPEESLEGIGGMQVPREDVEPDERATHAPDYHHHRPHAREMDHHHRPHEMDRHEPAPHAKETGHHHRPFDRAPSIRQMTEEEARILGRDRETGHHHRPFDKGAGGWAAHPDPRGFVPHQKVKAALIKRGFSPEDASAITGNLIYESGGNQYPGSPVILNPATGGQSGDAAWGSAQWEGRRKAGLTSPSLDAQVEHIWNEMHGSEAASYAAMRRAKTVAEKAHIVNTMYERPQYPRTSDRERIRAAEEAYRGREEAPGVGHAAQKRLLGKGNPADFAESLENLHDHDPASHAKIAEFLRTGGHGMGPATTDWCASFVGSALHHAGYRDIPKVMGGDVATAYERWGTAVAAKDVRRGDAVVTTRGLRPGALGGHVAIATGPMEEGEIPVIEGDVRVDPRRGGRHQVARDWETARPGLMYRRGVPPAAKSDDLEKHSALEK